MTPVLQNLHRVLIPHRSQFKILIYKGLRKHRLHRHSPSHSLHFSDENVLSQPPWNNGENLGVTESSSHLDCDKKVEGPWESQCRRRRIRWLTKPLNHWASFSLRGLLCSIPVPPVSTQGYQNPLLSDSLSVICNFQEFVYFLPFVAPAPTVIYSSWLCSLHSVPGSDFNKSLGIY